MKTCKCKTKLKVIESRMYKGNQRRKYRCPNCFTEKVTIEIEKPEVIAEAALAVFKNLGRNDMEETIKAITGLSYSQTSVLYSLIDEFKRK
jgi:transcriptional regulator NrdR family protein